MIFKYRVKGKVESAFILRGLHFAVSSDIDFCIKENELQFIKDRCRIEELINLDVKPIEIPEPVLEEKKTESETKPKGVNNGVQKPRTNSSNKNKHKNNA